MLDWKGLLKWSLTHTDGTAKKDIKEMDEETKKWLTEAMTEHALQDVKRIQEILEEVYKPDTVTKEDEQNKIRLLEDLEEIVDNLDMADTLYNIGGLTVIINLALYSKYPKVQQSALSIFITCNQNNSYVQQWSINEGGFKFLNLILNSPDVKTKEWALSAISSLVRGENLQAKRNFIQVEGLEFILNVLQEDKYTEKMKNKAFNILKDLVMYDFKLHQTYSNLDSFSNTNAKVVNGKQSSLIKPNSSEKNNNPSYDQNQELKLENLKEENAKYKNLVKDFLINQQFCDKYFSLLGGLENNKIDIRTNYLDILKHIIEYSSELRTTFKNEKTASLKQLMLSTMQHNSKNDSINQEEIALYKDILVILSKAN